MVCNKFFDQLGIPHQASKGIIILIFYAICVAFYMTEEKWDLLKCIYFVTVTITTIGYGDVTPTKDETKIFTIFVIIIGIFVITGYIADVVGNAIKDVFNWCLKLIFPKDSERDDGLEGPSHYIAKVVLICVLLLNLIFVAVIFLMVEADESFVDSLYWAIVSITSVGYGDISLVSDAERIFVIVFVMAALFTLSAGVSMITEVIEQEKTIKTQRKMMRMELDLTKFQDVMEREGKVDKFEFVISMIEELGVIDRKKHVAPWVKKFEDFDQDGSGYLDAEDLKLLAEEQNSDDSAENVTKEEMDITY